jgi:hypothetical protein
METNYLKTKNINRLNQFKIIWQVISISNFRNITEASNQLTRFKQNSSLIDRLQLRWRNRTQAVYTLQFCQTSVANHQAVISMLAINWYLSICTGSHLASAAPTVIIAVILSSLLTSAVSLWSSEWVIDWFLRKILYSNQQLSVY